MPVASHGRENDEATVKEMVVVVAMPMASHERENFTMTTCAVVPAKDSNARGRSRA